MANGPCRVTYVGHATVLLELGGARVLTDPVLRDRVLFLLRRQAPPPDFAALAEPDLVLVSHAHYDHLDTHSLRQVATASEVIVPAGCAPLARRAGATRITELDVGDRTRVAGLEVLAVRADHGGPRRPLGPKLPAIGYLLGDSPSVYFAGDTDLYDEMRELRGRVDIALLPVAGWGPKVGFGHLDAERAARAVEMIRPKLVVPIHWGTFAAPLYRIPDLAKPPRRLAELVTARSPEVEIAVLEPGESTGFG